MEEGIDHRLYRLSDIRIYTYKDFESIAFSVAVDVWASIGGDGSQKPSMTPYEEALDALSSLITKRSRADKSNKGDCFDLLFDYVKVKICSNWLWNFLSLLQIGVMENTRFLLLLVKIVCVMVYRL